LSVTQLAFEMRREEVAMKTVSWILLAVVAFLVILGGAASISVAYFGDGSNDVIVGTTSLRDLPVDPQIANALRGRRGTAAALALGFGILLMAVIVGPYRRGEVWAWWAIGISTLAASAAILLRVPTLGLVQGTSSVVGFLVVLAALLLDAGRLKGEKASAGEPSTQTSGDAWSD
jgi:hypothetical protein